MPSDRGEKGGGGGAQSQMPMQPFFTNAVQMNLCQEHFPEPIMMFKEKPMCKKCISREVQMAQDKFKGMNHTEKAMNNVKMLGLAPRPVNQYQNEKQKITKSI